MYLKSKTNKISNIRFGFATNSSSSHSIIIPCSPRSYVPANDEGAYGWEDFCLTTPESKQYYLKVMLYQNLKPRPSINNFNKLYSGVDIRADNYVDHNSFLNFPKPYMSHQTMIDYWNWLNKNVIENSDIIICGGNDNSDRDSMQEGDKVYNGPWTSDYIERNFYFKIDPTGFLTIFNPGQYKYDDFFYTSRKLPSKIRFKGINNEIPKFGLYPDLVDYKVTNACLKNCQWCYQDSVPNGKHADINLIKQTFPKLRDMGVFEIAIGGGEPTSHPQFIEILESAKAVGITPNFSTQSTDWLKKKKLVKAISKHCGAVAFSTQKAQEAYKWYESCAESLVNFDCSIHYILGAEPIENFRKFINELCFYIKSIKDDAPKNPINVILLKWKECGRAGKQPYSIAGWWDIVREFRETRNSYVSIGVDSFLVDDVEAHLPEINKTLYNADDGYFSFYLDAVDQYIGKHSSMSKKDMIHFDDVNLINTETWSKLK